MVKHVLLTLKYQIGSPGVMVLQNSNKLIQTELGILLRYTSHRMITYQQILSINFSITREKMHYFRLKSGAFFRPQYQNTQNLLISQGYIFRILQHFATKFGNFTYQSITLLISYQSIQLESSIPFEEHSIKFIALRKY